MSNIYPVITLYQPWATWIMRGWKTIETRTHNRFACLEGQRILIHAGKSTDASAINTPYLTREQKSFKPDEIINGCILGGAFVKDFKLLEYKHSKDALIECYTERYGLFLESIFPLDEPIKESGEMGIWYYDLARKQKVKKPKPQQALF